MDLSQVWTSLEEGEWHYVQSTPWSIEWSGEGKSNQKGRNMSDIKLLANIMATRVKKSQDFRWNRTRVFNCSTVNHEVQ